MNKDSIPAEDYLIQEEEGETDQTAFLVPEAMRVSVEPFSTLEDGSSSSDGSEKEGKDDLMRVQGPENSDEEHHVREGDGAREDVPLADLLEEDSSAELESGSSTDNEEDEDMKGEESEAGRVSYAFSLHRVRELLRWGGDPNNNFSKPVVGMIAKSVELLIEDMVRTAAELSQRRPRQRVTSEDIAQAVNLYDRFSFLSAVIPPPASTETALFSAFRKGSKHASRNTTRKGAPSDQKPANDVTSGSAPVVEPAFPATSEKEDNIDNDLSSDSSRGSLCKAYVKLTLLKEKLIEERRAISQDVQQLREESVKQQQASEIEEESLANRLIRKVENEERNIYNYKQKVSDEERARDIFAGVLRNAMQEQSNMENQLEADQELFLITMQRRMMEVAKKNRLLEQELYQERNRYLALISEQMHRIQEGLQTSETQRGSSEGEVEGNDSLGGEKTSQADILSLPPSTAQKPLRSPLTSPLLTSTCRSTKADPALQSATVSRGAQSLPSLTAAKEQTFSTVSLDGKDAESTTSKLLPVNHHATLVEALNERLRQLMEQNAAKEKQGKEYEQQFSELVQQFFSVQEQVAVERAKADKMKQDLKILQQRLLTHRSSRSTPSNYPSMTLYPEDSMAFSHESLSLAQTPIGTDHSLDLDNCHPQMLRMIPSNSGIYSSAGMLPPAHSDPPHFLFRSTGMASPGARLSSGMHGTIDDVVLGGTDPSTSL